MDSQDTTLVMSSQATSSRRRPRDEEPLAPRRRRRIPSNRSLVIVFKVEPAYNCQPEGVFAKKFHNEDTEVHAWSEVEGVGHYRWLQGPLNHLPREQQLEFIAEVMRQIFIFLRCYLECWEQRPTPVQILSGQVQSPRYSQPRHTKMLRSIPITGVSRKRKDQFTRRAILFSVPFQGTLFSVKESLKDKNGGESSDGESQFRIQALTMGANSGSKTED
uniref:Predicted protein n=1 Tax=Physcomitrium patens TaxID=3218 RepID=A9U517_PHYPA